MGRHRRQLDTNCCSVLEVEDGQITSETEHFFDLTNWTGSGPEP
jgi:ketosteroid isomerase-like protein